MLLAALQASTQNSRRTNIKWLKNEGPTKIVSSSVTENRTGTLGLNINFRPRIEWWLAVAHSQDIEERRQRKEWWLAVAHSQDLENCSFQAAGGHC